MNNIMLLRVKKLSPQNQVLELLDLPSSHRVI